MINFIAELLSLLIILITPFYLVWRKPGKRMGKIILSLIFLLALVDFIYFINNQISTSHRLVTYRGCIRSLNKELNSNRDEEALQSTLANWLENKNYSLIDLRIALVNLQSSYIDGDAIKYPADEQKSFTRPISHRLSPKGPEVDYSKVPGYATRVEKERKNTVRFWLKGDNVIISGKIRLSDNAPLENIASHTSFLPGGVFAKCVYPGESLDFIKSGYEPIYLNNPLNKKYPDKGLDMGELVMLKLPPEQQKKITFSVEGADITDVSLVIGVFCGGGYECAAPVRVCVGKRKVKRGEKVTFNNLSPVAYKLELSAPGHVKKTKYFTLGKENLDFGKITLNPSRKVTFRQRPFADTNADWEVISLEINGKTELVVAPKDELGNTVSISLEPDIHSDKILASFSWGVPKWSDYKVISPDKLDGKLPQPTESIRDKFLKEGHLYRFVSDMKKINKLIYLSAPSPQPTTTKGQFDVVNP